MAALVFTADGCTQLGTSGRVTAAGSNAVIAGVTDGDTITLAGIGRTRLIGIDTPEVYGGAECYGRAASSFTKRVLEPGTRVRVRIGRESHDRYGRTLAYVWLPDGTFFNQLLAERGYATPLTIPPNDDYAQRFMAAARRARERRRGLWADGACSQQNASSLTASAAHGSTGGCGRFHTQAEAQAWWESARRPQGYDGDGDGRVCEALP